MGKVRYNDRYHVIHRCHTAVWVAIRNGELSNPRTLLCVDCGKQAREYDHYKGYEEEFKLTVEPVCVSCHRHREFKRGEKTGEAIARGQFGRRNSKETIEKMRASAFRREANKRLKNSC